MFELAIGDSVQYVIEFWNDIAQSTSLRTARRIFQYKRAYFYPPVGDSHMKSSGMLIEKFELNP